MSCCNIPTIFKTSKNTFLRFLYQTEKLFSALLNMIFNNSTGSDQKFYEATDNSQQNAYFSDRSIAWLA